MESLYGQVDSTFSLVEEPRTLARITDTAGDVLKCETIFGESEIAKPEAHILGLTCGDIISFHSQSHSSIRLRIDLDWSAVKDDVPYVVTTGSPIGGIPQCRGCDKKFTDRTELRIKVDGKSLRTNYPCKFTFCLNISCIERAIQQENHKKIYSFPLFSGSVRVSPEVLLITSLENLASTMQGVNFVIQ
eukprot:TRINITY_DN518_c1_g1_i1.p1 TRINITY_DN518_c1_g1~~TRINITY_DN518_c1_g1_i1.p1  ORF type:complete len:189 (-),score=37.80 TRINITY_DN518_c1_g1_i1:60-626(-)